MKIPFIVIFALAISFQSAGQKSPIKFGVIPMEDMQMKVFPEDSSAVAVVLADYGEWFEFNFERHKRIKILKKEGTKYGDVRMVMPTNSRLVSVKAATYNLVDGKVEATPMTDDGIFRQNRIGSLDEKKFTLPNVKEGSVIEYSYKVVNTSVYDWQFQEYIPTRWSEYLAIIPLFFTFEKYMQGYLSPTTYETKTKSMGGYQAQSLHWVCKNVPAFKPEPFMTCERDYISKINFALSSVDLSASSTGAARIDIFSSWNSFIETLLKSDDFGKTIIRSGFLEEETNRITAGITEPMKKIEAIHSYVRENMEWDGHYGMRPDNIKKVVEKRSGDAADINFLLAAMLDKAGFPVEMITLSTRDHGFIREQFPMQKQFNYVICSARVDGKPILLDATERYLPYTMLPLRCLNGQGLLISTITPGWIEIARTVKSKSVVEANLMIDKEGNLRGGIQFSYDGYPAADVRETFKAKGEQDANGRYDQCHQ